MRYFWSPLMKKKKRKRWKETLVVSGRMADEMPTHTQGNGWRKRMMLCRTVVPVHEGANTIRNWDWKTEGKRKRNMLKALTCLKRTQAPWYLSFLSVKSGRERNIGKYFKSSSTTSVSVPATQRYTVDGLNLYFPLLWHSMAYKHAQYRSEVRLGTLWLNYIQRLSRKGT